MPTNKTIHSSTQREHFKNTVDDQSLKAGGKQHISITHGRNMQKRFDEKREETNKVLAAAPGSLSLCDLPAAKRRKMERAHQKRQKIIEEFGFEGLREVSCRKLLMPI